jgi:hypothetical protein
MICSSFVHLSRPFVAGMVKSFAWSHYPPSHVPAGSSLINLLSIQPTTPSLYKKFTCSTASCGSNDTHILFVCVGVCVCICIYTRCVHCCMPFWAKCHGFADSVIECRLTAFVQHSQKIYGIRKWCDVIEKKNHKRKLFVVTKYNQEVILVTDYVVEIT